MPDQKVADIADIVTPSRVMFTIMLDFNLKEWLRTLGEIEQLGFDQAVFSHSISGSPIGAKADVALTREYITDMQVAILAEFQKRMRFDLIPAVIEMSKYANWAVYAGYAPWAHSRGAQNQGWQSKRDTHYILSANSSAWTSKNRTSTRLDSVASAIK